MLYMDNKASRCCRRAFMMDKTNLILDSPSSLVATKTWNLCSRQSISPSCLSIESPWSIIDKVYSIGGDHITSSSCLRQPRNWNAIVRPGVTCQVWVKLMIRPKRWFDHVTGIRSCRHHRASYLECRLHWDGTTYSRCEGRGLRGEAGQTNLTKTSESNIEVGSATTF